MKHYLPLSFLCILWLLAGPLFSQDISGDWYGLREYPEGRQMRMILHLSMEGDSLTANYDSPDGDVYELPLSAVQFEDNTLSFRYERAGTAFQGVYNPATNTIAGVYTYGDEEFIFLDFGRTPLEVPEGSFQRIVTTYDKQEVYIPMRDGVRLFTSIYTPKDQSEARPILLWRTPYNSEPSEEDYSGRLWNLLRFLEEGYIIVYQDVRGRFMSEGTFVDVRPFNPNKEGTEIDENSDTYDTIDWLVNNVENNNGRVGIFGISYPGFYATMALPDAHPALKAASPQAPVCDWFIGDDWHHNGAFFLMDAFSFYSTVGQPRPEPTRAWPESMDFANEDNYDFFLDLGPVKNVHAQYFGDSIQFWSDLMAHPNYDDFWKARNPRPHLTGVKPAVLVVGGWFDAEDLFGPLQTYRAIETQNPDNQNRIIMGPWYHGQWNGDAGDKLGNIHFGSNTGDYYRELEVQFFNYYLKEEGEMDLPEATMFFTGANEWKQFDTWPPADSEPASLYLHADGGLSFDPPTAPTSYDVYIADPDNPVPYTEDVHRYRTIEYLTDDQRFASRRPDVMTYQTDLLTEDMTLAGPVDVEFFVSTSGTDADYVVKIIDVFPDQVEDYPENDKSVPMGGYQMLVRGEVLRGKFRDSFEEPTPFEPGTVTRVAFQIPDLAHTFKAGHRLMIQVQNSWFPLVDRNPQQFLNIYEADEDDFIKATHRIYHDATHASRVQVRLLEE